MRRPSHVLLLGAASLALAACASDAARYPTLARRAAEYPQPPPPPPAPAPQPSAEVLGKLEALVARARIADARFRQNAPGAIARIRAASGAAVATDSWAEATIALSDLESQRSEAMIALADLDAIYAAERIAGTDTTAIEFARGLVLDMVAQDDAVLAGLRGALAT